MLSKEVIQDRLQALIPEEERHSNRHSKDHDATEDVGRGSVPDSPSSPGVGPGTMESHPGFEFLSRRG